MSSPAGLHPCVLRALRRAAPLVPLVILLLGPAGCRGGPESLRRDLARDLEAVAVGGASCPEEIGSPAEPRGVVRGHSLRDAVVTCQGVVLRTRVDLPPGAHFELSLTALAGSPRGRGGDGEPTAVVELRRGGETATLLEVGVGAAVWTGHRLEVPDLAGPLAGSEPAELLLRSTGRQPVAWAELFAAAGDPAEGSPPNLVLVSLDTVRADHLSLYGYHRPTTPRLEGFAREALVFDRSLSSSTWTLPSTATLLTGLLPAQHGALSLHDRLAAGAPTLAGRLREAGYRTAALTDGGFVGLPWGMAQGFHRYDTTPGPAWQPRTKDAARTFTEAADWARRNRHHPFFLFLHTYEAHQPYLAREGFADPFLRPGLRGRELRMQARPRLPPPGPDELETMIALYDGEIARADHYLGTFLDALEEAGLGPRTAVVVTSDHGEELLEHGDLEHAFGKVFDPNVRVPLVVRPPGGAGGGRRIDAPVSGIDVVPTLLDLAGLPHDDLPGRSLLEVADGSGTGDLDGRAVLVHGTPSFPDLTGERYRLDRSGESAILDRTTWEAGELLRYRSAAGRAAPWGDDPGDPDLPVRLGAILAWLRGDGLLARLPDDATRVAVPEGSRIRPRGVWSGHGWREWPEVGASGVELAAEGPHLLAFGLAAGTGGGGWELRLTRGGTRSGTAPPAPYRLIAERRPPWDPFAGPVPPPGVVLVAPDSPDPRPGTPEIDRDTLRELRALGYVQ